MEFRSDSDTLFAEVVEPRLTAFPAGTRPGTLVLLHPTPLNHRFWLPVALHLPGYRLILPDLRGHGRSPLGGACQPTEAPVLTMEQLGRDLIALLDVLGIERAVVGGCSIGGYTLYELWRAAPGRCAGAIFCNSKPQADTDTERAKRAEWIAKHEAPRLLGATAPTEEFVDTMLTALLSDETRAHKPEVVASVRAMMEQVSPLAIQAIQRGLGARPDSQATADSMRLSTCVIAGEEDVSSTPDDLSALHAMLARAGSASEYHLLTQAGHYAPMEQPQAVAGILDRFLRRL